MRFRCIIRYCPRFLGVIPVLEVNYLYLTHPCAKYLQPKLFSFDLHVLGTPPAFVLSQDQTLRCKLKQLRRPGYLLQCLTNIKAIDFGVHLATISKNFLVRAPSNEGNKLTHSLSTFQNLSSLSTTCLKHSISRPFPLSFTIRTLDQQTNKSRSSQQGS